MFLSALISQLEPDGSLVVDLADDGGPRVRFGPLAAGMDWAQWEGGRWVATDDDHDILLVNQAHDGRPRLPVNRYLAGLPRAAVEVLYRIRWLQATVLQLWGRWPAARDLLDSNPVLLWLVAERYAADPGSRPEIGSLLGRTQRAILEWLLQRPVRPADVRFLRKVVLDAGDRRTLLQLRRIVASEEAVTRLRHWQRVPAGFLLLLAEAPWLADLQLLRQAVEEAQDDWEVGRLVTARRQLLRDTARLATLLRPDGGTARLLVRCRSWGVLKAAHDELLRIIRELGWESVLRSDVNPAQALPAPPIPSCKRFIAIRSVAELIAEGEKMHHCVVTRAPEVMEGRSAIYKVNVAGQRATIEISIGLDGEPLGIEDFRLACNADPSRTAWAIANEWLYDGRRQWNEARAAERGPGASQAA